MTPIAEGVETPGQAAALAEFGCTLAQGFHLGRPMDAAAARAAVVGNLAHAR